MEQQRMGWLDNITDSMDTNLSKLWEIVENRGAWLASVHGTTKSQTWLREWTRVILLLVSWEISTFFFFFEKLACCHCCSAAQLYLILCNPMDCSTPCFSVFHYLPEFAQTHVHWVDDAIQPSHPLLPPSPPTFNLSQNQSLFQWISSLHQVAKALELQLQYQSFKWMFRVDFL